jgi:hypothetical protein
MSQNILKNEKEFDLLWKAKQAGFQEELVSYAKQIQRQLSAEGDTADWLDCLEMAYNELIFNTLH